MFLFLACRSERQLHEHFRHTPECRNVIILQRGDLELEELLDQVAVRELNRQYPAHTSLQSTAAPAMTLHRGWLSTMFHTLPGNRTIHKFWWFRRSIHALGFTGARLRRIRPGACGEGDLVSIVGLTDDG